MSKAAMFAAMAPAEAPASKRAARKDVEKAFLPIATTLGLNFKENEEVDYTAANSTYLVSLKGGKFQAVTVGSDGATRPVFPKLAPKSASELTDIYKAVESVIRVKSN